jgi:hypothetical protein
MLNFVEWAEAVCGEEFEQPKEYGSRKDAAWLLKTCKHVAKNANISEQLFQDQYDDWWQLDGLRQQLYTSCDFLLGMRNNFYHGAHLFDKADRDAAHASLHTEQSLRNPEYILQNFDSAITIARVLSKPKHWKGRVDPTPFQDAAKNLEGARHDFHDCQALVSRF